MFLQSMLVIAGLALGALSSATTTEPLLVSQVDGDDGGGETFKGKIYDIIHGEDGWTYFILGGLLMAMRTSDFPSPNPAEGTQMTATGCTPDPSGWGWICTGLS